MTDRRFGRADGGGGGGAAVGQDLNGGRAGGRRITYRRRLLPYLLLLLLHYALPPAAPTCRAPRLLTLARVIDAALGDAGAAAGGRWAWRRQTLDGVARRQRACSACPLSPRRTVISPRLYRYYPFYNLHFCRRITFPVPRAIPRYHLPRAAYAPTYFATAVRMLPVPPPAGSFLRLSARVPSACAVPALQRRSAARHPLRRAAAPAALLPTTLSTSPFACPPTSCCCSATLL